LNSATRPQLGAPSRLLPWPCRAHIREPQYRGWRPGPP